MQFLGFSGLARSIWRAQAGGKSAHRALRQPQAWVALAVRHLHGPKTLPCSQNDFHLTSVPVERRSADILVCGFWGLSSPQWNPGHGAGKHREPAGWKACASVTGRGLVWRDERFPPGACGANRSRTARSSPQGGGAKGWEANVRPKEHKWAVRQDVGGECASKHEAQEPLAAFCRAQRRERKEQTLTRGDPRLERGGEVSRGHSSD